MAPNDEDDRNPFAAPQSDLAPDSFQERAGQSSTGAFRYATFSDRFAAAFVDGIIINVFSLGVGISVGLVFASTGATGSESDMAQLKLFANLFSLVFVWLYCALQESSNAQATFGKRLFHLRVQDLNGEKISFGRATGRYFSKIPSAMLLLIGYLMQPFTERKQALHDMMAGTIVVKN